MLPGGFRSSGCSLLNPTLPEAGRNRAEYDRIERDFRGIGWHSMTAPRNEALTGYNVEDTRGCGATVFGSASATRFPSRSRTSETPAGGVPGFLSLAARVRGTPLTGDIRI